MHHLFIHFCTFAKISWFRTKSCFKLFCSTHHKITLAVGLRQCSYLKEFLKDPQSFPVDWLFQRWSLYISLVLHATGVSFRMASFTSRCVSFIPLIVNQMSCSDVPEFFIFFGFLEKPECRGFQSLEMTSLWREFPCELAAGHVLCDLRCVI